MRLRVRYRKTEALRYIGTLDMQKVWERTLRRAGIPVQYSQGFHPQPKIQIALPLPVGFLSDDEVIDFWCCGDLPAERIKSMLEAADQPGIELLGVSTVPDGSATLQNLAETCAYQVCLLSLDSGDRLAERVQSLLAHERIDRVRRGKSYDLRPLIRELMVSESATEPTLLMTLSAQPGATGRPEEVLDALGLDPFNARYLRTRTIFREAH